MSYEDRKGALAYFIPNIPLSDATAGVLEEMDIGASSADHGEMICIKACTLRLAGWIAVGELAGGTTTAPTVIFTRRPTPLSATGEVIATTLTVPDATAVGASIVNSALAVDFEVGDSMEISHTVGVGTPTGIGFWYAEFEEKPEVIGNNSEVTETA